MALLEWKDNFSVKIAEIDMQHQRLIEMLNGLHSAMKEGKGSDALSKIIGDMAAYTVEHFKTEEDLFARHGYPEAEAHKKEHDDFVFKVADFQKQLQEKKMLLSLAVSEFLRDWLTNHILKSDQKYTAFLNSKGVF